MSGKGRGQGKGIGGREGRGEAGMAVAPYHLAAPGRGRGRAALVPAVAIPPPAGRGRGRGRGRAAQPLALGLGPLAAGHQQAPAPPAAGQMDDNEADESVEEAEHGDAGALEDPAALTRSVSCSEGLGASTPALVWIAWEPRFAGWTRGTSNSKQTCIYLT